MEQTEEYRTPGRCTPCLLYNRWPQDKKDGSGGGGEGSGTGAGTSVMKSQGRGPRSSSSAAGKVEAVE